MKILLLQFLFLSFYVPVFAQVCEGLFAKPIEIHEFDLALENGDQKIKALRFGGVSSDISSELSKALATDVYNILEKTNDVKIIIDLEFLKILQRYKFNLTKYHHRIRVIPFESPDMWVRDWSKPLIDGRLLIPNFRYPLGHEIGSYEQNRNTLIPDMLKIADGKLKVDTSLLPFEGGDMVVGSRHIFMGQHVLDVAQSIYRSVSRDDLIRAYEETFGKEVILLNTHFSSPIGLEYHADLKVAVVRHQGNSKEYVLLNSPLKFLELLIGKKIDENSSVETIEKILKGAYKKLPSIKNSLVEHSVLNMLLKANAENLKSYLEDYIIIKRNIEEQGYEVLEMPGFNFVNALPKNIHQVNYVNSVIGKGLAFVPEFGVRLFDDYAKRTFASLGYNVVPMKSAPYLALFSGGPRCACEAYYLEDL